MQDKHAPFTDPAAVASYARDTPRKVPGLADLHRMAMLLLAEQAPAAAHVLVVGAGGGLELKAFAEKYLPKLEMHLGMAKKLVDAHHKS